MTQDKLILRPWKDGDETICYNLIKSNIDAGLFNDQIDPDSGQSNFSEKQIIHERGFPNTYSETKFYVGYTPSKKEPVCFMAHQSTSITYLIVSPEEQNNGHGTEMLSKLEQLIPNDKIYVHPDNERASNFYKKHGYLGQEDVWLYKDIKK